MSEDAKASIDPFVVLTIAMFDVTDPSCAFNVDTSGCGVPSGQSVRKPSGPEGTTVAFVTIAWAFVGTLQSLPVVKGTVSSP